MGRRHSPDGGCIVHRMSRLTRTLSGRLKLPNQRVCMAKHLLGELVHFGMPALVVLLSLLQRTGQSAELTLGNWLRQSGEF